MTDHRPRQPPAERFAQESLLLDLHAEIAALRAEHIPTKHGQRQKTLYKHAAWTIALFVMEPDAMLPEHATVGMVSVQPLEGELSMTVGGVSRRLNPGNFFVMSPGVRHDVRAVTAAVFLLQVSLETPTQPH